MQEKWGVGEGVGTLGLSLYVMGLAVGPMFTASLSEVGLHALFSSVGKSESSGI